jgi:hypothetical protein
LFLLVRDGLGELFVFLALLLKLFLKPVNGLFKLLDNDFFFVGKIQFENFCDLDLHSLTILLKYFVLFKLKHFLNLLKANVGIRIKSATVKDMLGLGVDEEGVTLKLKCKAVDIILLSVDVVLFVLHFCSDIFEGLELLLFSD